MNYTVLLWTLLILHDLSKTTCESTSAKNISVQTEWICQSRRAPSEASETPRGRMTPCAGSIPRIALHKALQSLFQSFFSLRQSPILNEQCGGEGQLWPYVAMGSLGTRLNRDCNAMGDGSEKTTPPFPSTCAQNAIIPLLIIHLIPSRQI